MTGSSLSLDGGICKTPRPRTQVTPAAGLQLTMNSSHVSHLTDGHLRGPRICSALATNEIHSGASGRCCMVMMLIDKSRSVGSRGRQRSPWHVSISMCRPADSMRTAVSSQRVGAIYSPWLTCGFMADLMHFQARPSSISTRHLNSPVGHSVLQITPRAPRVNLEPPDTGNVHI